MKSHCILILALISSLSLVPRMTTAAESKAAAPEPPVLSLSLWGSQTNSIPVPIGQVVEVKYPSQYPKEPGYAFTESSNLTLLSTSEGENDPKGTIWKTVGFKAEITGEAEAIFTYGRVVKRLILIVHSQADYAKLNRQGISGQITMGRARAPLKDAKVHILKGKVAYFAAPNPKHPNLVKIIQVDGEGHYEIQLDPGEYTVLMEHNGKMFEAIKHERVFRGRFTKVPMTYYEAHR